MIQDFLQRHFEGTFYVGSLKHEKRSKETRERVANAMTSLKHRVSTSDSSQSSRNASVVSQYEEVHGLLFKSLTLSSRQITGETVAEPAPHCLGTSLRSKS